MPVSDRAAPTQCSRPIRSRPEQRREERHQHRRRAEHQRAVRNAGTGEAGHEAGTGSSSGRRAQGRSAPTTLAASSSRVCRTRRPSARPRCRLPPEAHAGNHGEEDQRRARQPQRVEGLGIDLAERVLDDGVVRAPEDRHQEQEEVDHDREGGADAAGLRGWRGGRESFDPISMAPLLRVMLVPPADLQAGLFQRPPTPACCRTGRGRR